MVYAFQGNAYQIGQYYLSPVYVWQANAFQFGMYTPDAASGGPTAYTLTGNPGIIRLSGAAATLHYVPVATNPPGCAFQGSAFSNSAFSVCVPSAGLGGSWKPRRKKYATVVVRGKAYVVPDGAEQAFVEGLLDGEVIPKKLRPKAKPAKPQDAPVPIIAQYALPDYAALRAEFERAQQAELLRQLDAVAWERVRLLTADALAQAYRQMIDDEDEDILFLTL